MSAYTPTGRRYSLRLPLTMGRCQELGLWVTMTADDGEDDCGACADGTHILCFNCDEHFTGNQESDDFLNWEYCAGRKDWACCAECRYKWDDPCDDVSCVYCGNCEDSEPAHRCDKCNIEFVEDDNDFCGFKPFHIDVWWCESCWYDEYKCEPTRDGE